MGRNKVYGSPSGGARGKMAFDPNGRGASVKGMSTSAWQLRESRESKPHLTYKAYKQLKK